jgi:cellulose synthase/poly-beta-1,6-N-acetylglucosamine synthase-like glycosyltransferase
MTILASAVIAIAVGLALYTFVFYPAVLKALALFRHGSSDPAPLAGTLPSISIVIPIHNEAAVIAGTLERILALDYPAERRQILVVSDASSDGSDEIVTRFAARGVELLRLPQRSGKTAAENASRPHLTGEIIINTDASVRIDVAAAKHLVAAFADPSVGVASGRDVSVSNLDDRSNPGEHAYVGYDMWVRDLETSLSGIVGASGCLYAIRRDLHMQTMPDGLSRDFGSALVAREHGYRAVSVPAAVCYVPRSASLRREYRRKVRTMARGLRTLWFKRALLDPFHHGVFAWMLWTHKLCRWLTPWAIVAGAVAIAVLAPHHWWALATVALGGAAVVATGIGWLWPEGQPLPRLIALPSYAVSGNIAALQAWFKALGKQGTALWEPTRRGASSGTAAITSHSAGPASRPA